MSDHREQGIRPGPINHEAAYLRMRQAYLDKRAEARRHQAQAEACLEERDRLRRALEEVRHEAVFAIRHGEPGTLQAWQRMLARIEEALGPGEENDEDE